MQQYYYYYFTTSTLHTSSDKKDLKVKHKQTQIHIIRRSHNVGIEPTTLIVVGSVVATDLTTRPTVIDATVQLVAS